MQDVQKISLFGSTSGETFDASPEYRCSDLPRQLEMLPAQAPGKPELLNLKKLETPAVIPKCFSCPHYKCGYEKSVFNSRKTSSLRYPERIKKVLCFKDQMSLGLSRSRRRKDRIPQVLFASSSSSSSPFASYLRSETLSTLFLFRLSTCTNIFHNGVT